MATTTERQEVRAQAKWVRTSARKARLVTEHIRGRSVPEARSVLAFTQRAAAREVEKVLRSAVANAESRPDRAWIADDLVVDAAYVDEGPTLKRWRARARGRAARIKKRTCHITIVLIQAPEKVEAGGRRRLRGGSAEETVATKPESRRRLPTRKPAAKPPTAETAPVGTAKEAPAEAAPAAEKPKPKRRAPVRRKKTNEGEKE